MAAHRSFNPYRRFSNQEYKPLSERAVGAVDEHLTPAATRQRKRRKAAQETLESTVEAVLADLLHATLAGDQDEPSLSVGLSKNEATRPHRYKAPIEGRNFGRYVGALEATDWITLARGRDPRFTPIDVREGKLEASRIGLGPHLLRWLETNEPQRGDFCCNDRAAELLLLKGSRRFYSDAHRLEPYAETSRTQGLRSVVTELNQWIAGLRIECSDEAIDLGDRQLRRIFNNGRFDHGGRLYGGFWQTMKREERRTLTLEGEPVATLDYGQAFARMLYGRVGVQPPQGDLYALPSIPSKARPAVKRVFNALFFSKAEPKRLPKDARKEGLPRDTTIGDLLRLLREKHSPIAAYLPSEVGYELFFQESEILLEVLNRCRGLNIAALPLHDAIIVPASKAQTAKAIMEGVFTKRVGVGGDVGMVTYAAPASTPMVSLI